MKTRSGIFILALILAISGCSKDDPTATGGSALISSYLMPDAVGQKWCYTGYEEIIYNDTLGNLVSIDTISGTMYIEVISRDSVNDYQTFTTEIACYRESPWWTEHDTGRVRYAQNDTILAEVAYKVSAISGPKQKALGLILFGGKYFKNIEGLRNALLFGYSSGGKYDTTLTTYAPPRILLDYPLSTGKEWVHYNTAWLSHRKVEKYERTNVDGEYYYCWKIKSLLDTDNDGNWDDDIVWHDWYNSSGMAKRHIEWVSTWTSYYGEVLGTNKYVLHYELANP